MAGDGLPHDKLCLRVKAALAGKLAIGAHVRRARRSTSREAATLNLQTPVYAFQVVIHRGPMTWLLAAVWVVGCPCRRSATGWPRYDEEGQQEKNTWAAPRLFNSVLWPAGRVRIQHLVTSAVHCLIGDSFSAFCTDHHLTPSGLAASTALAARVSSTYSTPPRPPLLPAQSVYPVPTLAPPTSPLLFWAGLSIRRLSSTIKSASRPAISVPRLTARPSQLNDTTTRHQRSAAT
ncbi:hypothetical protein P153DRAFT_381306 [Dothidotthia symphoricarpi CBS 119687]|uniref:Uncharacterized protein n=1 Tax=Dothidotthia symphoricarpi CBS 119687 TaxID=1392245 RepID=A0A6A6ATE6_9PLEO|nr:uncharacterized protein P153DRAFT_381306 [Dothidotthia symphoricarpi CBS 119687]KAF2134127.1 hypothetical protein P153DRAFT_381306 [Dothidotthia symphoricarpi CBS 119687]